MQISIYCYERVTIFNQGSFHIFADANELQRNSRHENLFTSFKKIGEIRKYANAVRERIFP